VKRPVFAILAALLLVSGTGSSGGVARAEHIERTVCPVEPTREFPSGFKLPLDRQAQICDTQSSQWKDQHVGGWGGGACPAAHRRRTPVVFVHGTTTDAWFWRASSETSDGTITNVRERFIREGYCAAELWAISYTGEANPRGSYGGGYYTYNDINAEEVWRFILAVRDFTSASQVDVVGHSLGVTVVRKAMFLHRNDPAKDNPYRVVRRAVMIAGANHGTTTCRGGTIAHPSHVCDEVDPVSAWLTELNAIGESPGPTRWMSVCDCLGADQFYEGPDVESPLLAGSVQVRLPGTPHITLARGKAGLDQYMPFVEQGSILPVAPPKPKVLGAQRRALPSTGIGGVPVAATAATLSLSALLALALVLTRKRTP
jgi:pimeloyl-ACP methyl ester carboxylesterase